MVWGARHTSGFAKSRHEDALQGILVADDGQEDGSRPVPARTDTQVLVGGQAEPALGIQAEALACCQGALPWVAGAGL